MQTHEHKVLRVSLDTESDEMETLLDQLGSQGWTLLASTPSTHEAIWIFRRVYVVGRAEIASSPSPEVEEVET